MVIQQLVLTTALSLSMHFKGPRDKFIPQNKQQNPITKKQTNKQTVQTNLQSIPVPSGLRVISTGWEKAQLDNISCKATDHMNKNGEPTSRITAGHCVVPGHGVGENTTQKPDFIAQLAILHGKDSKYIFLLRRMESVINATSGTKCKIPHLKMSGTIYSHSDLGITLEPISRRHHYIVLNGTIELGDSGYLIECDNGSIGVIGGGLVREKDKPTNIAIGVF
ncbi:MAG: hypothetical protein QNJ31_03995 [Candidatus Caenarcaniphilales bacterium]|nr:hypothetical protein [Candidatus Caenarcaniphilales bacterium]